MRIFILLMLFWASAAQALSPCDPGFAGQYTSITERYESGLLFRVEKCDEPVSYVFGTVHSDDPALYTQFKPVFDLSRDVDAAYFEYVEPEDAQAITARYMFLDPRKWPQGLPGIIGIGPFTALAEALKLNAGFPAEIAAKMKPWAAAVILQYPKSTADGVILDARLQARAREYGTDIRGLESMESQFALFDTLPAGTQLSLLKETLQDLDQIAEANAALVEAYKSEDLGQIADLANTSIAAIEDPVLREFMQQKVLINRNHTMAEILTPELPEASLLVAVGAMHLPGEEGLLALLEQQGYAISAYGPSASISSSDVRQSGQ